MVFQKPHKKGLDQQGVYPSSETFALITGSSHGIGRAMAEECARRGMNLLLVALDEPKLYETGNELAKQYGIVVDCLGIDLTTDHAPKKVHEWCLEKGYLIDVLINNAGFGRNGQFNSHNLEEYRAMMRLNNQVMVELTYHFLPMLQGQSKAFLLNMSSMEATLPIPYKAVYSASKHFVYGFSLALREESKETGLQVSVLCPGPTLTNEDGLRRIKAQGWRAKIILMMPEEVATIAIRNMLRGKNIIIPGKLPIALIKIAKLLPTRTKMALLARMFRNFRDKEA